MKIAICASEVVPFAKTGGLADVAGALPLALEKEGQEVIVIMPGYKAVKNFQPPAKRLKEGIAYTSLGKKTRVYFIENENYFGRDALYGDKNGDYPDNLERFSFYCRRALELLRELDFRADILHVHDWQASLVPLYLKLVYAQDKFFKQMRSLLTIHNIGYQGLFPKDQYPKLGIDWNHFNMDELEFYGQINILKGGMVFSDIINTVSPTYSKEIQSKEFAFGLEGVLAKRRDSLFGILNGLDYSIWNPETDQFIPGKFSAADPAGKAADKAGLQKLCRLPQKPGVPLFGVVSRLAQQKGFDILAEGIDAICKMGLQIVILGTGDQKYHQIMEGMAKKYPEVISLHLKFDDALAHKIYAGSDIFLMPSRYEPCGLGQLIALRYGTIPLVYKTGGLADTVDDKNGFLMLKYTKDELIARIGEAIKAFGNKPAWEKKVLTAMKGDFSWEESAKKYIRLYEKAKAS